MVTYSDFVRARDGQLEIEGVSCVKLAEKFGTPLFVISEGALRSNYRQFYNAFQSRYSNEVIVCVGMKANYGLALRKIIVQEGGGGDAFGSGELYIALLAGSDPAKIVMNGSNKSVEAIKAAIESNIIINIDSLDELMSVVEVSEKINRSANICLRIRLPLDNLIGKNYIDPRYKPPGIDISKWEREFKFGMEPEHIYEALKTTLSLPSIKVKGLMYHGGIPRRAGYYKEEVDELMKYIRIIKDKFNWEPEVLDLGGGFAPKRYGKEDPPSIDEYATVMIESIISSAKEMNLALPKLILEPGRWCIENAVTYLTRVGAIKADKKITNKKWVYVDGNINEMGDPFDSFVSYHHVVIASQPDAPAEDLVDICGQLCNAADILAANRKVPKMKRGDLLAFLEMGAYNESFANQSNAMPRSATILVNNENVALIRRRETIQDIISRDSIPYWLLSNNDERG